MPAKKADQVADMNVAEDVVTIDRRRGDRRTEEGEAGATNAPRPKKQRRRHIDPTTCERDYSEQEIEFMRAMDDYKRASGRMFPTCSEVLEVIRSLGYFQLDMDQIESLDLPVFEPGTEMTADSDGSEECEEEFVEA